MKRFWPVIERNPNYNPHAALAKPWLEDPRLMVVMVVIIALEVGAIMLAVRGAIFLEKRIGIQTTQYVIAAGVIGAGVAAHSFRKAHQLLYGMMEVVFAGMASIRVSLHLQPQQIILSQWVALVGCAYVVVRGLSNVSEARKKAVEIRTAKAVSEGL